MLQILLSAAGIDNKIDLIISNLHNVQIGFGFLFLYPGIFRSAFMKRRSKSLDLRNTHELINCQVMVMAIKACCQQFLARQGQGEANRINLKAKSPGSKEVLVQS